MPEIHNPPYRQIRAHYDEEFITVYQAYKTSIADAAVSTQKLSASPDFRPGRMTWIKPSWSWAMYRSGYSFKDPGQERILAIKMRHKDFLDLLEQGVVANEAHQQNQSAPGSALSQPKSPRPARPQPSSSSNPQEPAVEVPPPRQRTSHVRIQWDPERTPALEQLPYRSIQIGIPAGLSRVWTNDWIAEIVDVTDRARALKRALDEKPGLTLQELVDMDLVPIERPYNVPENLRGILQMDGLDAHNQPQQASKAEAHPR